MFTKNDASITADWFGQKKITQQEQLLRQNGIQPDCETDVDCSDQYQAPELFEQKCFSLSEFIGQKEIQTPQ